ncbi:MAG: hypothetical protein J0L99_00095 [Chitinophagales bacterium]|nr:hypothetical protein [Chitinophagales bacterium]
MRVLPLFFSFFLLIEAHSQSCIEKIIITYEPFEIKNREPVSIEDFEIVKPTDTISNSATISALLSKFQELQKGEKVKYNDFSPKMLIRLCVNGEELFRFYYTSFKRVYYNGYYFEDDKGLLQLVLKNISSDDKFLEKLKSRN